MATAKKTAKPKVRPIGVVIDELWQVKQKKSEWAAQEKEFNAKIEALESEIYETFDEQQTTAGRGTKAGVTVGETQTFNIVDFDALTQYIGKKKYYHLLQRRVSVEAAREIFERDGKVPGLEPFTKRKLNITTIK